MLIKLDENLPRSLGPLFTAEGHEVDTLIDEGIVGEPDERVWATAQTDGALLITQDLDFSDIRRFQPGTHCGIVLLRLRDPGKSAILSRMKAVLRQVDPIAWARCLVVITDHKVRIRRPVAGR